MAHLFPDWFIFQRCNLKLDNMLCVHCCIHLWSTFFQLQKQIDVYMHRLTKPSMFQKIACRLVGAKPFSEPKMRYCYWDPEEQESMTFQLKFIHWKMSSWKWRPFVEKNNTWILQLSRQIASIKYDDTSYTLCIQDCNLNFAPLTC